jgi:hypothetical protein
MSDDQKECYKMLCDLFGGSHHLYSDVKEWGTGIQYNNRQDLSTFDFNTLTTAVFMAHDRMIRLSIGSSGPGMVRMQLWERHTRSGYITERHPTIEDALEIYRKSYPISEVDHE